MICEICSQHGGYEGEPAAEAHYLVTITYPQKEAEANGPELLCEHHAAQVASAYLGWGWAVHFDLEESEAWRLGVSSLVSPGTTNATSGG